MGVIDIEDTGLLSDRIRNALTDAISSGELAPGTMLDEQQLADRYGASRTPVREALRQLATSGMVEIRPRRGVIVRHVTADEVMDMFETMAEIEAVCVRLATYRITPLERSRLLRIHEASEAAVEANDVDAYDALNREFHEAIYRAAHNDFLAEQAIAVRTRLNAFRRMQLRQDRRLANSRAEHDAVMRAIAQGDGEEAARRMRAHMLNAASALDSYIAHQDAGHATPPSR
ncbi:GntR family transcriptional regulator [Sphingomonas sp. OK281]|uniref:GntR family transcriptional regulator n=1 Tax=Sphingomonas sp. OK281 TaxID=1881067 RepID=UPI0008E0E559|nr:GntR family transcriptional regulator [Sphingomonas sp. OK281]SFN82415.1 transcriptional regulator, GntR family [Sphingomonas sp. OK281]